MVEPGRVRSGLFPVPLQEALMRARYALLAINARCTNRQMRFLSKRNPTVEQGWASSSLKGTSSKFQFQVKKRNSFRGTRSGFKKGTWNFKFQVPSSFCLEIWKKVSRFWMTHTAQKIASHNEQLFMLSVYRPKHYFKKFIAELIS